MQSGLGSGVFCHRYSFLSFYGAEKRVSPTDAWSWNVIPSEARPLVWCDSDLPDGASFRMAPPFSLYTTTQPPWSGENQRYHHTSSSNPPPFCLKVCSYTPLSITSQHPTMCVSIPMCVIADSGRPMRLASHAGSHANKLPSRQNIITSHQERWVAACRADGVKFFSPSSSPKTRCLEVVKNSCSRIYQAHVVLVSPCGLGRRTLFYAYRGVIVPIDTLQSTHIYRLRTISFCPERKATWGLEDWFQSWILVRTQWATGRCGSLGRTGRRRIRHIGARSTLSPSESSNSPFSLAFED